MVKGQHSVVSAVYHTPDGTHARRSLKQHPELKHLNECRDVFSGACGKGHQLPATEAWPPERLGRASLN